MQLTDAQIMELFAEHGECEDGTLPRAYVLSFARALLAVYNAGAQEGWKLSDGWLLVKRECIEEIKRHANAEFVNSYRGCGLHDESALIQNESIGEDALSSIRNELQMIEEDEKDRIAAHPQPITEAARDAQLALSDDMLCVIVTEARRAGNYQQAFERAKRKLERRAELSRIEQEGGKS